MVGADIVRMAAPHSGRATHRRLGERGGLEELLEVDCEAMPRAVDLLMRHQAVIEQPTGSAAPQCGAISQRPRRRALRKGRAATWVRRSQSVSLKADLYAAVR